MGLLDGKVGVVMGASSGIGWGIAERFVEEGAQLIIAARRIDRLQDLADKTGAIPVQCDVSDHDDVEALARCALDLWGRVDISVNSAGVNQSSRIAELTPDTLQYVAGTQMFGFYYFMKHLGNAHATSGGGSLINISSVLSILVATRKAAYAGSKAAVSFATKIAAREYGPSGVRFNALAPTFVPTAINDFGGMTRVDETRADPDSDSVFAGAFKSESPLGRVTTVDDCADVALFLASDLSSAITGQILPVDCGNHLMRWPSDEQLGRG